jgi:beta-galactosidase/beta-glucuronidase
MRLFILLVWLFLNPANVYPQADKIAIETTENGIKLLVDGEAFMVNGMNWDYFPIGTNYSYNLWDETEAFIKQALADEMSLLKDMGVNAIRVYTGIPQQWIQYIHTHYGIYTMLNHSFGRYGLTLDGEWVGNTDYADPRVKEMLLEEVKQLAEDYRNTPGLLLYLLGNENNYGLFWGGAETEDIPLADRPSTLRARPMYKLFNDAAKIMKSIDTSHPVAICNGDLLFLDIIGEECPDVDIFGTNMYRGVSFGNTFERVQNEYGKPLLFTEFGADAFNDITQQEDQTAQAYYLHGNWYEIYANAAGLGKTGNSIGGFTFQFSDGWWKHGQTYNLDVHDTHASWANGGYNHDYISGKNNMNEEWFGVCAKGHTNESGFYPLQPRMAYHVLREIHRLNPYAKDTTYDTLKKHFEGIKIK